MDKLIITYLTGIRHPDTVKDYEGYWETILDAWESWAGQTLAGRCLISVVANQLPKDKGTLRRMKALPILMKLIPDASPGGNTRQNTFTDKGGKLALAALNARGMSKWMMVADCDDHISRDFVAWLAAANGHSAIGWQVVEGYVYYAHTGRMYSQDRFHRRCGTCNVFDSEILLEHIPEITTIDEFTEQAGGDVRNLLARHNRANRFWKRWTGGVLSGLPKRFVCYHLEHGSNISLNRSRASVSTKRRKMERLRGPQLPVTREFIDHFQLKATPTKHTKGQGEPKGPGKHLQELIAKGQFWCRRCLKCKKCRRMARRMNNNGPDWCRENSDIIVNHMIRVGRAAHIPGARRIAHKLLSLAIERAENDLLRG